MTKANIDTKRLETVYISQSFSRKIARIAELMETSIDSLLQLKATRKRKN